MRIAPHAPRLGRTWKPVTAGESFQVRGFPWPRTVRSEVSHHEMGNPAGHRYALRLRNHDVHFDPLNATLTARRQTRQRVLRRADLLLTPSF